MRKVRTGARYIYDPVGLDIWDARTDLKRGQVVQVVKLQGCPPPNTMGHAHVAVNGQFVGLVCCNSLLPLNSKEAKERFV